MRITIVTFKKISVAIVTLVAVCMLQTGHGFAMLQPDPLPSPQPKIDVPAGYQVDLNALPQSTVDSNKQTAIYNIVFTITGALSLLMVTIGGFRYVASQGDPQAAARAKGTITYALIGLLVSISAVAIVSFVLNRT